MPYLFNTPTPTPVASTLPGLAPAPAPVLNAPPGIDAISGALDTGGQPQGNMAFSLLPILQGLFAGQSSFQGQSPQSQGMASPLARLLFGALSGQQAPGLYDAQSRYTGAANSPGLAPAAPAPIAVEPPQSIPPVAVEPPQGITGQTPFSTLPALPSGPAPQAPPIPSAPQSLLSGFGQPSRPQGRHAGFFGAKGTGIFG